jgi:hypothetical protein
MQPVFMLFASGEYESRGPRDYVGTFPTHEAAKAGLASVRAEMKEWWWIVRYDGVRMDVVEDRSW